MIDKVAPSSSSIHKTPMSSPDEFINSPLGTRHAELVATQPSVIKTYAEQWAIVVGVSEYKSASLNLKYADRDAEEFYKLLRSPLGGEFKADRVLKLTNKEATTANITKALRSFLKKPGRDDLVIIYLACHGTPDPDRPDNVYLMTHDTDPNDVAGTALPMRDIDLSLRENLLSERVVIFADTCHSGAIGGGIGRRSVEKPREKVNRYFQEISAAKGGVALLTSAEADEVSLEGVKWGGGHGVFTHYLLEGMRGAADTNKNGFVTVGELFEYVRAQVQEATGFTQHPFIGPNPFDRSLPLAIMSESQPGNLGPSPGTETIGIITGGNVVTPVKPIEPAESRISLKAFGLVGGIVTVSLVFFATLRPTPQNPTVTSPSPIAVTTLSNSKIIICHFPQGDAAKVKDSLGFLGADVLKLCISSIKPEPSTNAIWFGAGVDIQDVKLVAEKLRQKGIPLQVIKPFENMSAKPLTIEVGAYRGLPANTPVLTIEEIRNAKDFRR
jgi:hypothetical protein